MNSNRNNVSRPANTVRTDARDLKAGKSFYIAGNPTLMVADRVTYASPNVRVDYHVANGGRIEASTFVKGLSTMYVVQGS